jgi:hypothetical protein
MEQLAWLTIPLTILAFAVFVNGFPNIHIGKKEIHKHYHNEEDD